MKKITNTAERFEGVNLSRTFKNICDRFGLGSKAVLDIGCGYGQYLTHFGKGSVGITTAEEEVEFGKSRGLRIVLGNAERLDPNLGAHFEAFWANNIFEHLLSPHAFLMKLKLLAHDDALIIIGVPVVTSLPFLMRVTAWRGPLASNHVNFFTARTVGLTVGFAGWKPIEVRPFIFKSRLLDALVRPFAPHMYVIARNIPNFTYPPKKVGEWIGDIHYHEMLNITHQNG
ncbi:MAG: methyltransferase domain protein [Parcubacteria group bacterium]|nr:methyltransferase domain protein [Parcubacteria group bacterium]